MFHADGRSIPLGAKHQALLALLTTGEGGVRTRSFLENTLWCLSQPEQAKASLRTALSTLKRHLGADISRLLIANRERVTLRMDQVEVDQDPSKGDFMEGFELSHEEKFSQWLEKMRMQTKTPNVLSKPGGTGGPSRLRRVKDGVLPAITVLPFQVNDSVKVERAGMSQLTEDLTRSLARSQAFSVTSYMAAKQFDPKVATPAEVGAATRAAFMVGGFVSSGQDQLTIDLDLHDTRRQKLIWSRRYECDPAPSQNGNTAISLKMVRDISRTVWGDAKDMVSFTPLSDLENHTLLMSAIAMMQMGQRAMFDQARDILQTLSERESNHPTILCWQGIWHVLRFEHGLSDSRASDQAAARRLVEIALAEDPLYSLAHTLNGMIDCQLSYNFDAAYASFELALEDNPNEALALALKGLTCAYLDMPERAVELTEAARAIMPIGSQKFYYETLSAVAQLSAGRFDGASERAERALAENPGFPPAIRVLSVINQILKSEGTGQDAVRLLLSKLPEYALRSPRRLYGEDSGPSAAGGMR